MADILKDQKRKSTLANLIAKIYGMALHFMPRLRHFIETLYKHDVEIRTLKDEVERLKQGLSSIEREKATSYIRAFNPQTRYLTYANLKSMAERWLPRFGYNYDDDGLKVLGYMAHRICSVESVCVGRIAGNTRQILLRVMAARSIQRDNLEILEIGTLFGSGIATIYDNCLGSFKNMHITIIDPLSGYYEQSLDRHTRMPVTREIFECNMRRIAIPESDYTIIRKSSHDIEAIKQASKRKYDLLIIDGDHSYEGVRDDYLNYRPFVRVGGYIYLDDYLPNFPGIMKFVDEEVKGLLDVLPIGIEDQVAIFKVLQ